MDFSILKFGFVHWCSQEFQSKLKKKKKTYENTSIQIYWKFRHKKNESFQIKKKSDIFHISAQNIEYGYSLEPHRRGGSNEYSQSLLLSRNKKSLWVVSSGPTLSTQVLIWVFKAERGKQNVIYLFLNYAFLQNVFFPNTRHYPCASL